MKEEWCKDFPIYMLCYLYDLEKKGKFQEAEDFAERVLTGRLVSQYKPLFSTEFTLMG